MSDYKFIKSIRMGYVSCLCKILEVYESNGKTFATVRFYDLELPMYVDRRITIVTSNADLKTYMDKLLNKVKYSQNILTTCLFKVGLDVFKYKDNYFSKIKLWLVWIYRQQILTNNVTYDKHQSNALENIDVPKFPF